MTPINFYEILEITQNATDEEIRVAYKRLSKSVHPDRGGSAALFRLVNEAYVVLSDPIKRRDHDRELSSTHHSSDQTSHEDPVYVRFEDFYRQWKENRNKIACPVDESIKAGGIRKLVRSSSLLLYRVSDDPKSVFFRKPGKSLDFAICGRCGKSSFDLWMVEKTPPKFQTELENKGRVIGHQDVFKSCTKCGEIPSTLFVVEQQEELLGKEPIHIEIGDIVLFQAKLLSSRSIVFGPVIEGSATSENTIRSLKIKDEYSGELLSPKFWTEIYGLWKSNSLNERRTGSIRNWG
jgi:hypothetical protein